VCDNCDEPFRIDSGAETAWVWLSAQEVGPPETKKGMTVHGSWGVGLCGWACAIAWSLARKMEHEARVRTANP